MQQDAAATYSASAVDNAIELCFLLNQDTNLEPIKNAPPLVFFFHPHFQPNLHLYKHEE